MTEVRQEPTGALDLWRAELRRGVRTADTSDALRDAACMELNGLDALRASLPLNATAWFNAADRRIEAAGAAKEPRRAA
jgi:hypothetical protein